MNNWPNDDDGDALRELHEDNFDFNSKHEVNFQIEFEVWPPPPKALQMLEKLYGKCEIIEPDEEDDGYLEITKKMLVTYDGVVSMQEQITTFLKPFRGYCECWGVVEYEE